MSARYAAFATAQYDAMAEAFATGHPVRAALHHLAGALAAHAARLVAPASAPVPTPLRGGTTYVVHTSGPPPDLSRMN